MYNLLKDKIRQISAYPWVFPMFIALAGFLIYAKTLFFDYTYLDDNVLILNNYFFLKNPFNFFKSFTIDVFHALHRSASYYRPVLTISFMIDALIGKTHPFIYHLHNVLLHVIASCLVFVFLEKLSCKKNTAFLFSLIFAIHPVLSQAVAWLPGRNDLLLAVFVLAAFIYIDNFIKKSNWLNYLFYLLFLALAFFVKETSLLIMPMMLLYVFFIKKEKILSLRILPLIFGWFVVLLPWVILRQIAVPADQSSLTLLDMCVSLSRNAKASIQFLGKIFFPFNLSVFPIEQDTTYVYGITALIFLAISFSLSKKKKIAFVLFGLIWFLCFLLPSFIRPKGTIIVDFLEHRIYLPIVGIFIVLMEFDFIKCINFLSKKVIVLLFVLFGAFVIINYTHTDNFKNKLVFWKNAVKASPHASLAHLNLGAMYYLEKQLDKAEFEFRKALKLNPNEAMAHNNLGLVYAERGMFKEAEAEYKKEIKINPQYDDVYFNFGILKYKQEQLDSAIIYLQKALEINPDHVGAMANLNALFLNNGNFERARYYTRQLIKRGIPVTDEMKKALYL